MARYVHNSPISHVERVQTPVLIIQGDMDQVPIQQGEEFFTALLRQNKRARFVRYWGEEHSITSPANVRDMIYQVLSWLDEHLDVAREVNGDLVWDRERIQSQNAGTVLNPEDFARFDALELDQ